MKKKSYTSGEFAKRAHVTLRTIRYYDQKNILKPSYKSEFGARFYTDEDLARLQQILLLKYLGFSLDEIREMTIASEDRHFLLSSLQVQRKLLEEKMEQMKAMVEAIDRTADTIQHDQSVDWQSMLDLIHITNMEESLKSQYVDATNITARIQLHRDYSTNPEGWFPWLFKNLKLHDGMRILEVGCGNGELWTENLSKLPQHVEIVLSDISEGMLRDAARTLQGDARFSYQCFDASQIPFEAESFDLIIANHMLFYCEDIQQVLSECQRVLKKKGIFAASTYGAHHMQEITRLVQKFHSEIVLSAEQLYERFGLENGEHILRQQFSRVELRTYPDSIELWQAEPLIAYILSCHGNQNRILIDRYKEFREFVIDYTQNGFKITKDAGSFLCVI